MSAFQKDFIKLLATDDRERPSRVFEEWCELAYCSLAVPLAGHRAPMLETRYMTIAERKTPARMQQLAELLGMVTLEMQRTGYRDVLGPVMVSDEVNAQNQYIGQYFTPWDVCIMMAALTMGDLDAQIAAHRFVRIGEPACGAGAMVLAAAHVARERGHDVATTCWFDCTDLSTLAYQMCFIQMCIAGCSGVVRNANTLTNEKPIDFALTKPSALFFAKHGADPFALTEDVPAMVAEPKSAVS